MRAVPDPAEQDDDPLGFQVAGRACRQDFAAAAGPSCRLVALRMDDGRPGSPAAGPDQAGRVCDPSDSRGAVLSFQAQEVDRQTAVAPWGSPVCACQRDFAVAVLALCPSGSPVWDLQSSDSVSGPSGFRSSVPAFHQDHQAAGLVPSVTLAADP
jgi:hypothetical protein